MSEVAAIVNSPGRAGVSREMRDAGAVGMREKRKGWLCVSGWCLVSGVLDAIGLLLYTTQMLKKSRIGHCIAFAWSLCFIARAPCRCLCCVCEQRSQQEERKSKRAPQDRTKKNRHKRRYDT
jgi:hypothetical protein